MEKKKEELEKAVKDMIIKIKAEPIILSKFDMLITADEDIWKDYLDLTENCQKAVADIIMRLTDEEVLILSDYVKEMMEVLKNEQ